jgi:hypothetical protein
MGDHEPGEIGAGSDDGPINQLAIFSRCPYFDASIAGTVDGSVQWSASLYDHCTATQ